MAHGRTNATTPNHETANLIRDWVRWTIGECPGDEGEAPDDPILEAILAGYNPEAVCHLGRALICVEDAAADAPYRLGGDMCDPRKTEIARRLGMLPAIPA